MLSNFAIVFLLTALLAPPRPSPDIAKT